jgi:pimeloyl-ACP methyl ester carboxylesterase
VPAPGAYGLLMITLILLALLLLPFVLVGGILAFFWKSRRRAVLLCSAYSYAVVALVVLFGAGPYVVARLVTHSGSRPIDKRLKSTPADYRVPYEDVVFEARDAVKLSGWFVPPTSRRVVLICTHGLFRNRVELLDRIMPLAHDGYGAMLYDSRSHGSSDQSIVSLGYYERNDVLGAIEYVHRRYQDAVDMPGIVLMGVSMGAVATLEAAAESRDYNALILDSPFSGLRETIVDHSWLLFKLPRYPFPSLFLFWFQRIAGFDPGRVDSHKALQRARPVPLLLIASQGDERIRSQVAQALYNESKAPIKRIEVFGTDVPHGAAARLHPAEYSAILRSFLEEALGEAAEPVANQPSAIRPSEIESSPQ